MLTNRIKEERIMIQADVQKFLSECAGSIYALWFRIYINFYQKSQKRLYMMGEDIGQILSLQDIYKDDATVQMLISLLDAFYKIYMTFGYMELCVTKAGCYLREKLPIFFLMDPEARSDISVTIYLIHKDHMDIVGLYHFQVKEYINAAKEDCKKLIDRLNNISDLSKMPEQVFLLYIKKSLQDMILQLNDLQKKEEEYREMRPFDFVRKSLNTYQICAG